jgi:hypothetical protein
MAASTIPVPSSATSDNWVLISSVTPVAAASTVTFTSISGYRKLMFRQIGTTLATAGLTGVTFNGDTGTNYAYARIGGTTVLDSQQTQIAQTIQIGLATTTANLGMTLTIDNANTTGIKTFTGFGSTGGVVSSQTNGVYIASAAITTVTLTATTTFSGVGTVALYGVAA